MAAPEDKVTQDVKQIESEINHLNRATDELGGLICHLSSKLSPVSRLAEPTPNCAETAADELVAVAGDVRSQRWVTESHIKAVKDIIERVEL